jgi:four helix bundle protein
VSYENLEVYKLAYELAIKVHKLTIKFPKHETYEIGSQMRRAAVSIVLNIAEGYGRKEHQQDLKNFLITAVGSCNETTVLLKMVRDLGYMGEEESKEILESYEQLGRQISGFIKAIKNPKSSV